MNEKNGLAPGFGKRIKNRRKELKMTQRELAEKSGIAFRSIQDYESERRTPKVEARDKISDALKVPSLDLFMDRTPLVFSSPEDFLKARYGATGEKDGISWSSKTSYGDSIKNDTIFTFRQSGLSESEANELNNYYSYLMFKRNQAPTQGPEE